MAIQTASRPKQLSENDIRLKRETIRDDYCHDRVHKSVKNTDRLCRIVDGYIHRVFF